MEWLGQGLGPAGGNTGKQEEAMYVNPNFPTKKALKQALLAGEKVQIFSPGPFPATENGEDYIEGPHYPKPHTWYAKVQVKNGYVIKVLS